MTRFVYYNQNPDGDKENDCVTRAISLARGIPYKEIRKKLFHTAKLLDSEKLTVYCYSFLIEKVLECEPVRCRGFTVNEFASMHPYGVYLVRMEGHITTIIDGEIFDIWDCGNKMCDRAWDVS